MNEQTGLKELVTGAVIFVILLSSVMAALGVIGWSVRRAERRLLRNQQHPDERDSCPGCGHPPHERQCEEDEMGSPFETCGCLISAAPVTTEDEARAARNLPT